MTSFMETSSMASSSTKPRRLGGKLFFYVQELKEEMKRVSWTPSSELKLCTKAVVASTFLFGLGIYIADFAIKNVLEVFSWITRFIFG